LLKKTYDGGRLILELEPRVLLSADQPAAGLGDDFRNDPERVSAHIAYLSEDESANDASTAGSTTQSEALRELVIIDAGTPDIQLLLADLLAQTEDGRIVEVAVLDSDRSGIDQIDELLEGRTDISAIHIISHGSDGSIALGDGVIDQDTLVSRAQSIQAWGSALTDDGDILIYGCNLAATDDGRSFIDAIARLTGADVAGSDDRTGHADLGGDWDLEYGAGQVDANIAVSDAAQQQWRAILPSERAQGVIFSVAADEVDSGVPGMDELRDSEALILREQNLEFEEGGTGGTVSRMFDLATFTTDTDVDAIHYVSRDLTVGTNNFQLFTGDILLSVANAVTVGGLSVASDDIFIFRPDSANDYSSGTFLMLLDRSDDPGLPDMTAFTLVEETTTVGVGGGAMTLNAGTFLYSSNKEDIRQLTPGDLGDATTVGANVMVIDGSKIDLNSAGSSIDALELIENDVVVGDRLLTSGQILISLNVDDGSSGDNGIATERNDVFILDVTTAGSNHSIARMKTSTHFRCSATTRHRQLPGCTATQLTMCRARARAPLTMAWTPWLATQTPPISMAAAFRYRSSQMPTIRKMCCRSTMKELVPVRLVFRRATSPSKAC